METNQATGNSPTMDYSRPECTKKSWPIDDDIVIAGIAGRFPESDNMDELTANLINNIDMVTRDDRRWPIGLNDNQASRSGKIKNLDKFDNTYFCTLQILSESMEPGSRIILETTYEAIADAGIAPQAIRGSKTGVYVGINTVANAEAIPQDDFSDMRAKEAAFWVYGSSKALLANRISFLFDFTGPSTVIDTACSASMVAMANAVQDLRSGNCDMAVVATSNICLAPYSSYIFHSLGLLSSDGKCKVFDKAADGFVRSETVGSIFLMRRSQAKRIYATILHAKTNTDGFKTIGLFAPFWLRQRNLMIETFQEAGVKPEEVTYFESHGTGTNVGDPQEAKAVSEAYCQNRKDKLLVGAVKSNLGHTEGASGLCSVAKAIIIFENRMIPANLHFNEAKAEIESLHKTIEPVVTNVAFEGKIIGVNSFGVGGVNAHALLAANDKEAEPSVYSITKPMARLVNVCGRTEEAVEHIFNFIQNNPQRAHGEFLALLNDAMKTTPIKGSANFPVRGYMIIKDKVHGGSDACPYDYIKRMEESKRTQPVWLIFTGMGSQWVGMGEHMLKLDCFRASIEASARILDRYGIDLLKLILSDDATLWEQRTVYSFVSITAMQIGLFDVFQALSLPVDGIIGHSFGEIACAYADGCLSAEQALLTSYWRGKAVEECAHVLPKGLLAAVGLTWQEAKKYCTPGVYLACHNGHDSVTVSGVHAPMLAFMQRLKDQSIFVRKVAGGEFPYHSVEMNKVAPKLLEKLDTVIVEPKARSSKWISTSVAQSAWDSEAAERASGAYFVNNLINPVLFNEGMALIPKKALCIEMAPHALFDSIFKRCFKDLSYVSLMKKTEPDQLLYFLGAIGQIYTYGLNPSIERLYPKVSWPVARGTPSVASLIRWEHGCSHDVKMYPEYHNFATSANFIYRVSLLESDWRFLKDHCIDGRVVFPATGYLMLVWRAMATKTGQPWHKVAVHFENIRITRPTLMSETGYAKFVVQIIDKSGDFVVCEGNNLVCNGKIKVAETLGEGGDKFLTLQDEIDKQFEHDGREIETLAGRLDDGQHLLNEKQIYKELRIRGYDYGCNFQGLAEATGDGKRGLVKWTGHWISFIDSALHLSLLALPIRTLFVPVAIDSFKCDPALLFEAIDKRKQSNAVVAPVAASVPVNDPNKQQLKTEFHYFKEIAQKNEMLPEEETICEIAKNDETIPFEIMNFTFEGGRNMQEDEKKILFPVAFDLANQTLITKGMEVKGMVPINIPRKVETGDLLLEDYRWTPLEQTLPAETDMLEYQALCASYFNRLVREFNFDSRLLLPEKQVQPSQEKMRMVYMKSPEYSYLQAMHEILTPQKEENDKSFEKSDHVIEFVRANVDRFELDVHNDGALTCETLARPLLELVADNCQHLPLLKVLEITLAVNLVCESISRWLKLNVIHKFELNYTATKNERLKLAGDASTLKTIEWNGVDVHFLDEQQGQYDLIVVRMDGNQAQLWASKANRQKLQRALKSSGFLLTIERNQLTTFEQHLEQMCKLNLEERFTMCHSLDWHGLKHICTRSQQFNATKLMLYRMQAKQAQDLAVVRLDSLCDYGRWLATLQAEVRSLNHHQDNHARRLWIVTREETSGALGLLQCLRQEPGLAARVKLVFLASAESETLDRYYRFDLQDKTIQDLLAKDLVVNVYRHQQWGTFRFLRLPEQQQKRPTRFAYLSQTQRGDLSSLEWFESEHRFFMDTGTPVIASAEAKQVLCHVYYSALNFKDIVLASGKIVPGPESSLFDCILGLEFSGRRSDTGARVMGMVPFKGIATTVLTHGDFLWPVPSHWSLEEAASVPVIYITAYYALVMRGRLKKCDTVLIHSGAGGVGQAAINICQHLGCTIFVSVGSDEKRAFLRTKFGLDDAHICNSRDVSFERQVKTATAGRGVDVVLNSLSGEKLLASFRCVAANGRFLEIGKYDMQMNTALGMFPFINNITFHGVGLDCFLREGLHSHQLSDFIAEVSALMQQGIQDGVVRPIERTVFSRTAVEPAFRHMTSGQHIGKVIIEMRAEETPRVECFTSPAVVELPALARTWFHPAKVYIVAGGLGGVGLELVYWMVLRGARKLILTSRSGLKSSYQKVFLQRFQIIEQFCADYKITFQLSTKNIGSELECAQLLDEAEKLGPIGGIFNLTLVLEDGLFENQTLDKFEAVCRPKLNGLMHLDRFVRARKLDLEHFVAFSSFSAGRGNAGQTNYGYANSAMERIIERRNADGLAGVAMQFGPINDVGVVAEHMLASEDDQSMKLLMGLSMQRLNSCLEVLDRLLPRRMGVFSSYVRYTSNSSKDGTDDEVIRQLCIHLNIDKRPEDECLGDIGLDSITAVEIQQRLERDFNISLTLADVRKITVKELKNFRDGNRHNLKNYSDDIKKARVNLSRIRFVIPNTELSALNTIQENKPIYCLPPLKGVFDMISFLTKRCKRPIIAMNWTRKLNEFDNLKQVCDHYYKLFCKFESQNPEGLDVLATSFGSLIAALICKSKLMSKKIKLRRLILIDLLPVDMDKMSDESKAADYRLELLFNYISIYIPERICQQSLKEIKELNCERERIRKVTELLQKCVGTSVQGGDMKEIIENSYRRGSMMLDYNFAIRRKSKSSLKRLLLKVLQRNPQLQIDYIKMIDKRQETIYNENKLISMFDLDDYDLEQYRQRYRLHVFRGGQDDFLGKLDQSIQDQLDAIFGSMAN